METEKTVQLGEGHFKLLNEFQKYEGIFFAKFTLEKYNLAKSTSSQIILEGSRTLNLKS